MKENYSDLCNNPKIYATMRSLYRFSEIQDMNGPSILKENEERILHKYISSLTAEEILYISLNFNEFLLKEKRDDASAIAALSEGFINYTRNLN